MPWWPEMRFPAFWTWKIFQEKTGKGCFFVRKKFCLYPRSLESYTSLTWYDLCLFIILVCESVCVLESGNLQYYLRNVWFHPKSQKNLESITLKQSSYASHAAAGVWPGRWETVWIIESKCQCLLMICLAGSMSSFTKVQSQKQRFFLDTFI